MGADVLGREGNALLLPIRLDFYSVPLLSQEWAQEAHRSLDRL